MKQLKFFTNDAETLKTTQSELTKIGIAPSHFHIFTKDNTQHRFDGLILQSEQERESNCLRNRTTILVAALLIGSGALFYQWISFIELSVMIVLSSIAYHFSGFLRSNSCVKKTALEKVYFLVIDVDDKEKSIVENFAKNHPYLVAQ